MGARATNGNSIVSFDAVSFSHGDGAPVVHDLSLDVAAGEVLVLVGRSGAGKSTILRLANGMFLPTSGSVTVEGRDTRQWDGIRLRRRIGYVLQEIGLFPHMTVEANVGLVPRLERWPAGRVRDRTRELLELVGLPASTHSPRLPQDLSGGERQRVGVARALAIDPPMLLMDEPFGALDPVTRHELQGELRRIQRALGTTIVLVTHDMAEALTLAHRLGVIEDGMLIACDTPMRIAASQDPRIRRLLDTLVTFPGEERPS
jgi:osmoprotectant transport system ATP-binding protein